jgi:hypothetical protein
MTLTRTFLPHPVQATLEETDLRIGCVSHVDDPRAQYVAVMQSPRDAQNLDSMVCTLLKDWPAVREIIEGLTATASQAWGPQAEPPCTRHVIRTTEEHGAALQEVAALMNDDPALGTPEGDRLELLALLVEDYERRTLGKLD